jgi:hypothetical protein
VARRRRLRHRGGGRGAWHEELQLPASAGALGDVARLSIGDHYSRYGWDVTPLLGHQRGLYLLVPAHIAVLAGGVWSAWLILVKLSE